MKGPRERRTFIPHLSITLQLFYGSNSQEHADMGWDGSSWLCWWAFLCFAFLSSSAWVVSVFVFRKRNMGAQSVAAATTTTTSSVDVSQGTSVRSINTSSSSSVSGLLGYEYDVFLSFRGEDTRKGFTDNLYTALEGAGIRVFRDSERLAVGEEIGPELLHGIKHSSISIPIFSENYASSKWCLKELAFMMECREAREQTVLPVFYDVTPNQVQRQTGSYASAFRQHAKKQDTETVQRWRDALTEVGSLKGWELRNEANGHQGKLIKMIVTKILKDLKKAHLCAGNNLVGINHKVKVVMEMLAVDAPEVRFIGIWGMGGIGKTTLAKVIYNRILDDFDGCSFLQDVRETSARSHNGRQRLQSQLVAGLLGCDRLDFATVDEGMYVLKRRFREMKVLILLDDVDHVDQLSALAADADWFGRGSRIIITTRNKDVLRTVGDHQVYEVRQMGAARALQLFCKHALRKDAPPVRLRALSEEITERTGGLPLAVEVIGSFLHGKSEEVWKATSKKLKLVPNKEVQHKLRISYDALEREQQQIFLDVACLFIGEDRRTVVYIWEDHFKFPPEADIEVLQLLSLIKIGEDNKRLGMHDQLRDLGREIVRQENYEEPGKRSRLWGKEAVDVLKNNQGSRSIEAIRLEYEIGLENCYFTLEQFGELSKLRFLQLDRAHVAGNFEHLLPELRWLRWKLTPSNSSTTNLNLKNLLVLDVSDSRVTHNWNLWSSIQMMTMKLKVLDLERCKELTRTPDFSAFRYLERLNLRNCGSLEVIDPSIAKLKHLTFLNLEGCRYIKELPEQMGCKETLLELVIDGTRIKELPNLGDLKKLEILSAKNCECLTKISHSVGHLTSLADLILDQSKISELPESIGSLVTLRRLSLAGTPLKELPKAIGGLKSLVELGLTETKVVILPNSIANLINLEQLRIDRSSIHCIPAALGQLKKLKLIDASECQLLGEIPMELGSLSSLEVLRLRHTNIICIPETIRGLSCLETLDLAWCMQLRTLPELPSSLSSMSVTCQSLVPIPNLPDLINLKKLEFVRSTVPREIVELPNLEKLHISRSNASILLDEIGAFPMLNELSVSNISLQCLPRLPSSLHNLSISRCYSLARLTELSNLENLLELRLHGCPEVVEIEGLGDLLSLRTLSVSFCVGIANLNGLEMLECLKYLRVSACENLERLADLSKLSVLSRISISGCRKLVEIEGIRSLHALEDLEILEASVETLGDLSSLKSLRSLWLGCTKLQGLDGLDELEELRDLGISGCEAIERLPNLSNLKRLHFLAAIDCEKLQGLDGLDKLEALGCLWIYRCKSIKKLPNLSNLKFLAFLLASNCEKLEGLEGLKGLEGMDELDISGCKAIERLPDLSNLKSLRCLNAQGCEKLQGLEGLDKLGKLEELNIDGCKSIEKLPDLSNLTFLEYLDAECCEKLQEVQGQKEFKKSPNWPRAEWRQYLEGSGLENLQELDRLAGFGSISMMHYAQDEASMKLLSKSNWGLLRRWYADGCDKIPELEGLEHLEKYDLLVIPDLHLLRLSGIDGIDEYRVLG